MTCLTKQALAIFDFIDKFLEIVAREYQDAIMCQFGIKMGGNRIKQRKQRIIRF